MRVGRGRRAAGGEAALKSLRPPAKPAAAAAAGDGDDSGTLEPGQRVTYTAADGSARPAVVAKVHWDDGETPYYTIALAAGGERSTERLRLRKRAVGLPPLRVHGGPTAEGRAPRLRTPRSPPRARRPTGAGPTAAARRRRCRRAPSPRPCCMRQTA